MAGSKAGERAAVPTPLVLFGDLPRLAATMSDAVVVTDVEGTVVVWNAAAARLYGIDEVDALGRRVDELVGSTIVGEGTSSAGARSIALNAGAWHGRVSDRPSVGSRTGEILAIDAVLSRIDDPDGRPVGVIAVRRDVTAAVRVERELATVMSLTTAAGEQRTRAGAAGRALEVLCESTGAIGGGIAVPAGEHPAVLAERNASPALLGAITGVSWETAPEVRALAPLGRVIRGPVDLLPLAAPTRRAMLEDGVRSLVLVGLHSDERLIGVLALGWDREDPVAPSDAVILLAAAHVARSLENATLVEEIVRRAASERELMDRLRALDELTRVGDHVTTMEDLAARSARLIADALGSLGAAYCLFAPDGASYTVLELAGVPPALADWLAASRPDSGTSYRRWRAGEGAFIEPFAAGAVNPDALPAARAADLTAYAAIPIRVDDVVVGGIAAFFDRPFDDLHVDRGSLERVASIASISLANFRLRERLVDSEARYRSMFAASPDPVVVVTATGRIVDANEATLRLLGADRAWVVGHRADDLARFDQESVYDQAGALALGASLGTRAMGIRRDGSEFPADVEIAAVLLDGERRYLVRVRDLTDQERLQAELVQAQKMEATGQLVSGVAHELNNPLASILGFSQLIRRDPALPAVLRHDADLLVEEATRTRRIVQNLLDFARRRPPERVPTPIASLVESVLALQSYSLGKGRIEVETDIPDSLPLVELDRGQLQQVLVNLTHNAIYAIRHGGGTRLRIEAAEEGSPDDRRVRITVIDDGLGVPPGDVDRLFEAFFTTKPPADGTGLGLPVSAAIVASHGGELRYAPSPLGRGAAFTFDLPVSAARGEGVPADIVGPAATAPPSTAAEMASALGERPEPPITHSGRVLVLDDEASIRVLLDRALGTLGYEAVITSTGEEAIERAIGDGPWAAILCDHQMPGLSGLDVFGAIETADPALAERFVMMSGDVLDPALDEFAGRHALALLAKPFDLDTLERTLRGLAGAGAARGPGQPGGQPRGYV